MPIQVKCQTRRMAPRRCRRLMVCAAGAVLALAGELPAGAAESAAGSSIVPQGFWVLNSARSHSLGTGRQTLWVIKDDGHRLVWASISIDDQHRVKIASYDGAYGGDAAPVVGTPMTTRIVATGPAALHNSGTIAGVGDYSEDCAVSHAGKRFRCEGQIQTSQGSRHYADDFDWYGPSPPSAQP